MSLKATPGMPAGPGASVSSPLAAPAAGPPGADVTALFAALLADQEQTPSATAPARTAHSAPPSSLKTPHAAPDDDEPTTDREKKDKEADPTDLTQTLPWTPMAAPTPASPQIIANQSAPQTTNISEVRAAVQKTEAMDTVPASILPATAEGIDAKNSGLLLPARSLPASTMASAAPSAPVVTPQPAHVDTAPVAPQPAAAPPVSGSGSAASTAPGWMPEAAAVDTPAHASAAVAASQPALDAAAPAVSAAARIMEQMPLSTPPPAAPVLETAGPAAPPASPAAPQTAALDRAPTVSVPSAAAPVSIIPVSETLADDTPPPAPAASPSAPAVIASRRGRTSRSAKTPAASSSPAASTAGATKQVVPSSRQSGAASLSLDDVVSPPARPRPASVAVPSLTRETTVADVATLGAAAALAPEAVSATLAPAPVADSTGQPAEVGAEAPTTGVTASLPSMTVAPSALSELLPAQVLLPDAPAHPPTSTTPGKAAAVLQAETLVATQTSAPSRVSAPQDAPPKTAPQAVTPDAQTPAAPAGASPLPSTSDVPIATAPLNPGAQPVVTAEPFSVAASAPTEAVSAQAAPVERASDALPLQPTMPAPTLTKLEAEVAQSTPPAPVQNPLANGPVRSTEAASVSQLPLAPASLSTTGSADAPIETEAKPVIDDSGLAPVTPAVSAQSARASVFETPATEALEASAAAPSATAPQGGRTARAAKTPASPTAPTEAAAAGRAKQSAPASLLPGTVSLSLDDVVSPPSRPQASTSQAVPSASVASSPAASSSAAALPLAHETAAAEEPFAPAAAPVQGVSAPVKSSAGQPGETGDVQVPTSSVVSAGTLPPTALSELLPAQVLPSTASVRPAQSRGKAAVLGADASAPSQGSAPQSAPTETAPRQVMLTADTPETHTPAAPVGALSLPSAAEAPGAVHAPMHSVVGTPAAASVSAVASAPASAAVTQTAPAGQASDALPLPQSPATPAPPPTKLEAEADRNLPPAPVQNPLENGTEPANNTGISGPPSPSDQLPATGSASPTAETGAKAAESSAKHPVPSAVVTEQTAVKDTKETAEQPADTSAASSPQPTVTAPGTQVAETMKTAASGPVTKEERSQVTHQVAEAAKTILPRIAPGDQGQMTLHLHPQEWGEMQVSVRMLPAQSADGASATGIAAHVVAANPVVKAALESHSGELQRTLQDAGLKLERLTVTVQGAGLNAHSGTMSGEGRSAFGQGRSDQWQSAQAQASQSATAGTAGGSTFGSFASRQGSAFQGQTPPRSTFGTADEGDPQIAPMTQASAPPSAGFDRRV